MRGKPTRGPVNGTPRRKMVWDEEFQKRRDRALEQDRLTIYDQMGHKARRDMLVCTLMLWGAMEKIQDSKALELAPDILVFLERCAQVMIHRGNLDDVTKRLLLMRCTEDGGRLARETGAEDARGVALAAAYLILQLVDREMWADPECQAVYVSIGIIEEAQADGQAAVRTQAGRWPWDPTWLPRAAFRVEQLGRIMGYF